MMMVKLQLQVVVVVVQADKISGQSAVGETVQIAADAFPS